jgi:hypothetical protein
VTLDNATSLALAGGRLYIADLGNWFGSAGTRGNRQAAPPDRPRFWPSCGGSQDLADWIEDVKRRRPYLENLVRRMPESDLARQAQDLLAAAPE